MTLPSPPYSFLQPVLYKKYFEIQLYHASYPGHICEGFELTPTAACLKMMNDNGMGYKSWPGTILVYFSGTEVVGPAVTALISPPISPLSPPDKAMLPSSAYLLPDDAGYAYPVPDGTEFTFIISYRDTNVVNYITIPDTLDLRYYSPPGNNFASPPPYDDQPTPIPWTLIKPAMVSLQFPAAAVSPPVDTLNVSRLLSTSLNNGYIAPTEITSLTVYQNDQYGNINCYVDMSLQPGGCYIFQLASDISGTYAQQYYVDVIGETAGCYGIFRLIKDYQLVSPPDAANWAESPPLMIPSSPPIIDVALQDHHVFTYTFPAPP